jgi:ribosomal protein S18 acetylase RimI-like enzyme
MGGVPPDVKGSGASTFATRELTRETWADFERLFAPGRGWSFCACMLYQRGCHLDGQKFPDRASQLVQNQADKRALVDSGRAHGILVYEANEPIGWCQFGPAEELPLPGAARLDRRMPVLGAGVRWRITCFVTANRQRQRGVASTALRAALEAIRKRGGGLVEAYPTLTPHNPNWAHAGTVSLFEREGFTIVDRPSKKYVVMQCAVSDDSHSTGLDPSLA